jgi:hypothetical protein
LSLNQPLGRNVERIRRQQQVRFVTREIIQHRAEHGAVSQPLAQNLGREAGQREQPLGTVRLGEDPAERRQRKGLGISGVMNGSGDCQRP